MKTNHSSHLFPLLASLCVGLAIPACTSGDGAAGKDGVNGKDGVAGKDGAIGATGKDGKDGKNANSDDGLTCKPALGELNGGGTLGEIQPAPPSIGADVPVTYFGPAPSSVNPLLVGPVKLLKAGNVDVDNGTVTLPLYHGHMSGTGKNVWFILTDTDDEGNAKALGLNFSSKLTYAYVPGKKGARTGQSEADGSITFDAGTVNFAPAHTIVAGAAPNYFPPTTALPGSIGDADYSPLVKLSNAGGHVYNAPMIAFDADEAQLDFCNGNVDHALLHDKVTAICPSKGTVTLALTQGFSFGRPVLYLSTESSVALAAALEGATLAPGLADVGVGKDDSAFSAVERIFVFTNGPTNISAGEMNPQRQGLNSALKDGRGPLNVLGGIPTIATDYSPLWDMNLGEWSPEAVNKGYPARLTEEFQILGMASRGFLTGPGGAPYGSVGIIVNCPIVQRLL
jgi:hypothetical protein